MAATKESAEKDPQGGLTAAGRAKAKKETGANLKAGVTKPEKEMTPAEMKRKGSFLRRHFAGPEHPLQEENGEPTRHALQAHAWGEKVPKTQEDVRKLADKGAKLLEKARKAADKEK